MDPLTYLEERCSLRRNVLTGETLVDDGDGAWHVFSPEAANALILRAGRDGTTLDETTLARFCRSTLIDPFNPAESWLATLPDWDGTDRVAPLARRIVTGCREWPDVLHMFLLQMVARWRGAKIAQRDVTVPMLVGAFGLGKTTYCSLLLPPELRRYYTDRLQLRTATDVHRLVSTHLLVCADEYYQEHTDMAALSQYLFSRSEPVFRQPYGVNAEPRQAYAAVIGTTGNLHPMTDAAGAARLVCFEVERRIDLATPVDYAQLYAQLAQELDEDAPLELTDRERERRAIQNAPFQEADNLVKMVQTLYAAPRDGRRVKAVSIDAVIDRLMKEYPYWTPGERANQDVGFALQEAGFTRSRIHGRSLYRIVERDPRKLDFVEDDAADDGDDSGLADNPLAKALLTGLGGLVKPNRKPQ